MTYNRENRDLVAIPIYNRYLQQSKSTYGLLENISLMI